MRQRLNKAQQKEAKQAKKRRKELRSELEQISQRALAEKFGVTDKTIRKYEKI